LFAASSLFLLQPKDWSIKMNKKERRLALATALQSAAADVVVVDSIADAVQVRRRKSSSWAGVWEMDSIAVAVQVRSSSKMEELSQEPGVCCGWVEDGWTALQMQCM
jgi:RecA/RadA recombinase